MVLPRGWWLDDRRVGDALFAPPEAGPVEAGAPTGALTPAPASGDAPAAATAAPGRRRRRAGAILPTVPEDDEVRHEVDEARPGPAGEAHDAADEADEADAPAWRPV